MGDNENLRRVYPEADDFVPMREAYPDTIRTFYNGRVMIEQDFGITIRVILPISLDTGETVPFEVWVVVHQDDRGELSAELEAGDWTGRTCRGFLLNAVEPWPEVYGAPVTFAGQSGQPLPFLTGTEQPLLRRVLTEEWPRATIAVPSTAQLNPES